MAIIDLSEIKHQLRKDLMRVYLMLGMFGLLAFASVLLSAKFSAMPPTPCKLGCDEYVSLMFVLGLGGCLTVLLVLACVTLVQDDAPIDENAFWVSQPLKLRSLLVSKALLTMVFFLVVTAVVQMATLKVNRLSVLGSFNVVATSVYWYASLILISMLVASVSRSIQSALLIGMGLLVMRALAAAGVYSLYSPQLAWLAVIGGLPGIVWIVLAMAVMLWTYVAKSVRHRIKMVCTSIAIVVLTALWSPTANAPLPLLGESPQLANASLPSVSIGAQLKKDTLNPHEQLKLTLVTTAPRAGYRYRFSRLKLAIRTAGSAGRLDTIPGAWGEPVFVSTVAKNDGVPVVLDNRVTADVHVQLSDRTAAIKSIRDRTGTFVVTGFLVEEERFEFARTPVRAGQSTLYGASRFTIRSVSADSIAPQIAFDEISGGAAAQITRDFADGRVFVTSAAPNILFDGSTETWVKFRGGADSVRLVNIGAMQCYALVAIPSPGLKRTCGSMRALRDSVQGLRGNPDWLENSELFMTQWRHSSFAPVRLELPIARSN